jgi:hypothetical protein
MSTALRAGQVMSWNGYLWVNAEIGEGAGQYDVRVYGALGDGTTDDTEAIEDALAAAASAGVGPVVGGGKTYGVSGTITLPANTWLQDIKFKQLTPGSLSLRTLYATGVDNIRLVRVTVDRNGDGSGGALDNEDCTIKVVGGEGHYFEDVEVFGDDLGTGFAVWEASSFDVVRLHVHDMNYDLDEAPEDDGIRGFWFSNCSDFRLTAPRVHDLGGNYGSGFTWRFTQNVIGGCDDFTVTDLHIARVGEGFDLSGSVGNQDFHVIGGEITDTYASGMKLTGTARDAVITDVTCRRCDLYGFYIAGPGEVVPFDFGDVKFVNCIARDVGNVGFWADANFRPSGFFIESGELETDQPLGIKFINCHAVDRQTVAKMKYGFVNTSPGGVVDGEVAAPDDGRDNEVIDCTSIRHTVGAFFGMHGVNGNVYSPRTIAGGVVSVTQTTTTLVIDTESAAATDDLDSITGGARGQRIVVRCADVAHVPTVKNATGNIRLAGRNCLLAEADDRLTLEYDGSDYWVEVSRSIDSLAKAVTIASGVVAINPDTVLLIVDTESAAATDDLDSITGGRTGQMITLRAASGTRDVVVKDGTGNILLVSDRTLDTLQDTLTLMFLPDLDSWTEVAFANNA